MIILFFYPHPQNKILATAVIRDATGRRKPLASISYSRGGGRNRPQTIIGRTVSARGYDLAWENQRAGKRSTVRTDDHSARSRSTGPGTSGPTFERVFAHVRGRKNTLVEKASRPCFIVPARRAQLKTIRRR